MINSLLNPLKALVGAINGLLWGDLIVLNIGEVQIGLSILVVVLIPAGIYFTVRTRFLPFRMFPEMIKVVLEPKKSNDKDSISGLQALLIATASRVGMGNLAGVVAAISFGGAGAIFWMWVVAMVGSASAFVEATLAQLYKEHDPLYGGYRGGPAYFMERMRLITVSDDKDFYPNVYGDVKYVSADGKKKYARGARFRLLGILFALSGLLCWGGISQVVANSVTQSFTNAFGIPAIYTTVVLVVLSALILFKKGGTVEVLDKVVPIMGVLYIGVTLFILVKNIGYVPEMFAEIFGQAFGFRQAVAGGFGAILMNGVKRGLFSNEAGSGSAPCAAAAAECDLPVKAGLVQALGVFIDTIVICSCTAMIMLLVPQDQIEGLAGMELLQTAMRYHLGEAGVIFIAVMLFLFSFSTFLGILFYARSNVAYLFGDNWASQTAYKVLALVMLFIGGIAAYTFVWDLGDVGIGLMTIFNTVILYLMGGQALRELKKYEAVRKEQKKKN